MHLVSFLVSCVFDLESSAYSLTECDRYIRKVDEFLELLAILVLLTGGLPMRGTELAALKHSNDRCTSRNFVIESGHVVVVSEYNKTESVAGRPMVIVRYLPDQVGALVLAYLADVRPFVELVEVTLGLRVGDPRSPLMWEREGVPWSTEKISDVLGRISDDALGVHLTISKWRHIAIAIDRDLLACSSSRILTEEQQSTVNHVLQAGHGTEVAQHHYALSMEMLVRTTHESITAFRRISNEWHQLFGLAGIDSRCSAVVVHSDAASSPVDLGPGPPKGPSPQPVLNPRSPTSPFETPTPGKRARGLTILTAPQLSTDPSSSAANGQVISTSPSPVAKRSRLTTALESPGAAEREALKTLKQLYGRNATWMSDDQRTAVIAALDSTQDLVAVLAPGSGKSLLIMIPALLSSWQVTVAIVPFVALQDNLQARCRDVGLQTQIWRHDIISTMPLVLVTPEAAVSGEFRTYLQKLIEEGILAHLIFDECHVLPMDVKWREALSKMGWVGKLKAHRILLSGTLPKVKERDLFEGLDLNQAACQIIRRRTVSLHIQPLIHIKELKELRALLEEYIQQSQQQGRTILIFTMSIPEAEKLAKEFDAPCYHGKLLVTERADIIRRLCQGSLPVLVGTSGMSNGIDPPGVDTVIHWLGAYSLPDLSQQANRAGRRGGRARSVLLLDQSGQQSILDKALKSDDSLIMALGKYVDGSQCMRVTLSQCLDEGMEPLACDPTLEPCTFCEPGPRPRLKNHSSSQITHVSESNYEQGSLLFSSFTESVTVARSQVSMSAVTAKSSSGFTAAADGCVDAIRLQRWRERSDQLRLGQQCPWCYFCTETWGEHQHLLEDCTAQPGRPPPQMDSRWMVEVLCKTRKARVLKSEDKVHFMCFLPREFHPRNFEFSRKCSYDKLALQTVLLAAECQSWQSVFDHHGVPLFLLQRPVEDLAQLLSRAPHLSNTAGVNVLTCLFYDLIMDSKLLTLSQNN